MKANEKKARKCPDCGGVIVSSIEDYLYDEGGLSHVKLSGVEVRRCRSCKGVTAMIPAIENLHRALAKLLIEQPLTLRGEEVRFLRKYLGFRGIDFAAVMGVAKETVSRWETDAKPMGTSADRLLRALVQTNKPVARYEPEEFTELLSRIKGEAKSVRWRELTRKHGGGWEETSAAAE